MDSREALEQIRGLAGANRVRLLHHAWQRMRQRNLQPEDINAALRDATVCTWQTDNARWRVTGPDLDGDEITLVVVFEDGVIVVTVF